MPDKENPKNLHEFITSRLIPDYDSHGNKVENKIVTSLLKDNFTEREKLLWTFFDGNYKHSKVPTESAINLANLILKVAKDENFDLTTLEDIKKVMSYDKDNKNLSVDELAAYIVGTSFGTETSLNESGVSKHGTFIHDKGMLASIGANTVKFNNKVSQNDLDIAVEIGQQIFGDNFPENSSVDTSTEKSIEKLTKLVKGRQ